ncbi:MAG: MBL fold metallo-hydrolase [Eubacteriaceae bacterium]|nr:MBL fold metallo-hydrolase [Eubacteriaceae bacterium]
MQKNITLFTQSSIKITSETNGTIYADPFKMEVAPHDADFILLTHDHYDHFSPEDIAKVVKAGTHFVVPEKIKNQVTALLPADGKITTVAPGEVMKIDGLTVEIVPAYNKIKPFHPKQSGWVGYVLHVDGQTLYLAGDTDALKENEAIVCDIAMVPIGGTFTMNAKQAAAFINGLKPKVAIPIHYGSIVGKKEDAETFRQAVDPEIQVDVIMQAK